MLCIDFQVVIFSWHFSSLPIRLYIGDWRDAVNPRVIGALGITHILSIAGVDDYVQYKRLIPHGVELLMFCVEDTPETNILQMMPLALNFIHKGRCTGNILVHCVAGVSRSASFCIAYLIREMGFTYDHALSLVQKARPVCKPNPGFEAQLRQFERELHTVTFAVCYPTRWGESVHVVGSTDALGNWKPTEANKMEWTGDGRWVVSLPIADTTFEYKYVIAIRGRADGAADSGAEMQVEEAAPRTFTLSSRTLMPTPATVEDTSDDFRILQWEPGQNHRCNGQRTLNDTWNKE